MDSLDSTQADAWEDLAEDVTVEVVGAQVEADMEVVAKAEADMEGGVVDPHHILQRLATPLEAGLVSEATACNMETGMAECRGAGTGMVIVAWATARGMATAGLVMSVAVA